MRGTFANIRLRNQLAPGTEGGCDASTCPTGEAMSIYDAAMRYHAEGVPLVVLAGKEYGSGSSRDWAAKGPRLLGVRAVIAESYERIHRSNLVGMGILPLQFAAGETRRRRSASPAARSFAIDGLAAASRARSSVTATPGRAAATPVSFRRACASTRRRRSSTSATAASCRTCCASSPRAARRSPSARSDRRARCGAPPTPGAPRSTAVPMGSQRTLPRTDVLRRARELALDALAALLEVLPALVVERDRGARVAREAAAARRRPWRSCV